METAISPTGPQSGRRPTTLSVLAASTVAFLLAGCGGAVGDPASPPTGVPPDSERDENASSGDEDDDADPTQETNAAPGALDDRVIVIDPGHNGANHTAPEEINEQVDAGGLTKNCDTVGAATDDDYPEHEFNFALATELRDVLDDEGAEVILTRADNDGVGPCLPERAAAANDVDADAAISIHADGGPPDGRGFHIIAPDEVDSHTERIAEPSFLLGEAVRDGFATATDQPIADYINTEDGIHVRDDLGGLNLSTVPKVFLEAGNMRNAEDAELLADADWRRDAAAGLADGITDFIEDS